MHVAALKGCVGVVEFLIANGADINAKGEEGYTPLYMTAFEGPAATAELLIAKASDVNTRSANGRTPLEVAVQHGHLVLVDVRCKHGAND